MCFMVDALQEVYWDVMQHHYVDASDCIGPYSLCIDGMVDHIDVLCFSDAYM